MRIHDIRASRYYDDNVIITTDGGQRLCTRSCGRTCALAAFVRVLVRSPPCRTVSPLSIDSIGRLPGASAGPGSYYDYITAS